MSKRWLLASLLVVAALALGLALVSRAPTPVWRGTLEAWGLPKDLPRRLGGIKVLQLPPTVTRLGWLPDGLENLEVPGVALESLCDLPAGLRRLDLSYSAVTSLHDLPEGVEVLDLRWAKSQDLGPLSEASRERLRVLLLAGGEGPSSALPAGLYALASFDAPFDDGRFLPRTLRELYLQGPEVTALRNLPSGLIVLSLDSTRVRDLVGVPESVTSLAVHGTRLEITRWPQFLAELSVTPAGVQWGTARFPAFLRELRLVGHENPVRAEDILPLEDDLLALSVVPADSAFLRETKLPPHLERLDLSRFEGDRLEELPGSLSELVLADAQVTDLDHLPRGLRSLDLSGLDPDLLATMRDPGWPLDGLETLVYRQFSAPRLIALPPGLRELDVADSGALVDLGELPAGLERLDVSDTALTSLPDLPASLRFLSIAGARIDSVEGTLPDGLEELVLAPGQVRRLGVVPESLKVLRFDATAGASVSAEPATGGTG